MVEWNLFNLQNRLSPVIEEFIFFHDYLIIVLMFILSGAIVFTPCFFGAQFCNRALVEGQFLEALWTILPALALTRVALPCLRVLYNLDIRARTYITVKSVDSCPQYKTYSHKNLWITRPIFSSSEGAYVTPESALDRKLNSDDYIISKSTLDRELYSVLGIDERAVLPYTVNSQVLINGGADGVGTWYLPGVLVDWETTPGRIRHMDLSDYHLGLLYGECHPICGSGLNLLPVVCETVYRLESPPAPTHPPTMFYYALDLE